MEHVICKWMNLSELVLQSLLPNYFWHWVEHCEVSSIESFNKLGPVFQTWQKTVWNKSSVNTCSCLPKLCLILTCLLLVVASAVWNDKTSFDRLVVFLFRVLILIETPKRICFKISCWLTYKSGYMQCNIQTKLAKDNHKDKQTHGVWHIVSLEPAFSAILSDY